MARDWDEQEKRTDEAKHKMYDAVVKASVEKGSHSETNDEESPPSKDLAYPPIWQQWGFPAGLSIGIFIGLAVGYILTFLILL